MSRDIHITIVDAGDLADGTGRRRVVRVAGGPTNPGEDLTLPPISDPGEDLILPPVSDPGEDLTLAPVSDPGEDLTLPPVSDPDRLAQAIARALSGTTGTLSPTILHGAGGQACGCCCKEDCEKEGRGGYGDQKGLDYSGFVIVRLKPAFSPKGEWNLLRLAQRHAPALDGLRRALIQAGADEGSAPAAATSIFGPWKDKDGKTLKEPPALSSWPLLVSCSQEPVTGEGADRCIEAIEDCREAVRRLEGEAAKSRFRPLHSLADYWRVDARSLGQEAAALVERLNGLAEVDLAYRELAATEPGQEASFTDDQSYLDEAPMGIGARCVPSLGNGACIRIIDLEQGWYRQHNNLEIDQSVIFGGTNRVSDDPNAGHHGTAVVGELVGEKGTSTVATEGILPDAFRDLASHYFGTDAPDLTHLLDHSGPAPGEGPLRRTNGHVANAIVATLNYLESQPQPPSVLLLEVQRSLLPTEVDPADFDAIRLATALGVTVVEAAGNGGVNLDAYTDPRGIQVFNRRGRGFRDSGAILVGAAWSALPHNRAHFSNYGSRIDCYAWGDRVTTCGYGDLYGEAFEDYYTSAFSGTSSASPIIAGAAGLLQGLAKQNSGAALPPAQIRALLADPKTGTPQGPDVAGAIGVMPNLKAVLAEGLCVGEDVYIRKNPCDDGTPSPQVNLTSCPDLIFHSPKSGQDPKELFGEKGPFAHSPAIGFPGSPKKSKNIHARLRNRGLGKTSVELDVYGSRPATLLTSRSWKLLEGNPCIVQDVARGDQLTVSEALSWTPGKAPMSLKDGEWCALMAVAREEAPGGPSQPRVLPPDGEYFRLDALLSFYRRKTVGVRNVHVVPPNWKAGEPFAFDLTSTPDRPRRYDFELLQRLPESAAVIFGVPEALAAKLRRRSPWLIPAGVESGIASLELPAGVCLSFPGISLAAGVCYPARLQVEGPLDRGHSISLRQLYRGVEIGRITWLFREGINQGLLGTELDLNDP